MKANVNSLMSLIKVVLINLLLNIYFKTLLSYFWKIIKRDFYKPWTGADSIHAVLLLMRWPTPVPCVQFTDLTPYKHDLKSVFHFRGKEKHIIIYQVIGSTHKFHAEVREAVLLTRLFNRWYWTGATWVSFQAQMPHWHPSSYAAVLARKNQLNFHFKKRKREEKEVQSWRCWISHTFLSIDI